MAGFVEGVDRGQSTLFPARLDDYIAEDNPVRAVDVFVDGLDLDKLGFVGVQALDTGRPGYHPRMMLKLYIYGYLNRVPSSRRLERECQRNIEMIWLTGQLAPDFKTIADFRKDNGKAIREVCREFVALCRKLGLLSAASVAIDGSKFKAVNARDKNFTEAKMKRRLERIEESIGRYIAQLETADRRGDAVPEAKVAHFKDKIVKLNEEIARLSAINSEMMKSKDKQISLTDPDARSMATSGRDTGIVGYNVQTAVDTKNHLIVAHEVTNVGTDRHQLLNMAEQARTEMGVETLDAVADRGYYEGEEIKGLRGVRHHRDTAEATDLRFQGRWPLRQTGFCLCVGRGRLSLSCRRAANLPFHRRREWQEATSVLDERLQDLRAESPMHDRPRAAHRAMGARSRSREGSGSA
jgi:transposase